jgi:hypothetical protein
VTMTGTAVVPVTLDPPPEARPVELELGLAGCA